MLLLSLKSMKKPSVQILCALSISKGNLWEIQREREVYHNGERI